MKGALLTQAGEGDGHTHLVHSDDVHEVIGQRRCKSADLARIEQQGDGVGGMGYHAIVRKNDELEQGVVSSATHVGQRKGCQKLRGNFSVHTMADHLQST